MAIERHNCKSIEYPVWPPLEDADFIQLFSVAWPGHVQRIFTPVLARSLLYVCAYESGRLVGFVNIAWDGGIHAFLLDTTVAPDFQHQGIGTELVRRAAKGQLK